MTTWPNSSTSISEATLVVDINWVSHVIGSFRFPGKTVVPLFAADWCCMRQLKEMANHQEKVLFCFWYVAIKPVAIVQRRLLWKDAPSKNPTEETVLKAYTGWSPLQEGWTGPPRNSGAKCGTSYRSIFTQPTTSICRTSHHILVRTTSSRQ
jgi:hypothetical protein